MGRHRIYGDIWKQLKLQKTLVMQLEPFDMDEEAANAAFKSLSRAFSKERYEDILFKQNNPRSRLKFERLEGNRMKITLNCDKSNIIKDL